MYIIPAQTSITIYPYIFFPATMVDLQIIHKETKTTISQNVNYTSVGSAVSMTLPSLTPIANVAANLDELVVRIYNLSGAMLYEYMYIWITNTASILATRKVWTTTDNNSSEWITL